MPARSSAAYHAFVLTCVIGLPRKLNTCVGCLPSHLRMSTTASALSGTGRIVRLQVFGTRGWLHLLDHHILEICDVEGRVRRIEYPQVDIERAELEAFADAVAGIEPYPVPVEEAVHGVAVMEAAIRSAQREGQSVSAGLVPV